jgi:hypothetical protein
MGRKREVAKDKFVGKVKDVEDKIKAKKHAEAPSGAAQPGEIVDEQQIAKKITDLEEKIDASALSPSAKEKLKAKVRERLAKHHKKLQKFDENSEAELKAFHGIVLASLDKFKDDEPGVKELFDLSKKKDELAKHIDLKSYKRGSGDWRKIHARLRKAGVLPGTGDGTSEEIKKIQKLLQLSKGDGKVGPETINALSKAFALNINVSYGKKTIFNNPEPEDAPTPPAPTPPAPTPASPPPGPTPDQGAQPPLQSVAPPSPQPVVIPDEVSEPQLDAPDLPNNEQRMSFAPLLDNHEVERDLSGYSGKQKMEILEALQQQNTLSPAQNARLQKVNMMRIALQSMLENIEQERTAGETALQVYENERETTARKMHIRQAIQAIGPKEFKEYQILSLTELIVKYPDKSIDDLMKKSPQTQVISRVLAEEARTNTYDGHQLKFLLQFKDDMHEAGDLAALDKSYLKLFEYLRDTKDYTAIENLVEGSLFKQEFEARRKQLSKKQRQELQQKAVKKIDKTAAKLRDKWNKEGLSIDQQDKFVKVMRAMEQEALENQYIRQMNMGSPFLLKDRAGRRLMSPAKEKIWKQYADMSGADGTLKDSTWNMVATELMVNAPLIILSGGIANLARGALNAGVRAAIASERFVRIAARVGLVVSEAGTAIERTSRLGSTLYWGGRGAGLLAEGAVFDAAHTGMQDIDALIDRDLPTWGKHILISSITLGAFKTGQTMAKGLSKGASARLENLPFLGKSTKATMHNLLQHGTDATVTMALMLGVSAAMHAYNEGNLEDWSVVDELIRTAIQFGALKAAGGIIHSGRKTFTPENPPTGPRGPQVKAEGQGSRLLLEGPTAEGALVPRASMPRQSSAPRQSSSPRQSSAPRQSAKRAPIKPPLRKQARELLTELKTKAGKYTKKQWDKLVARTEALMAKTKGSPQHAALKQWLAKVRRARAERTVAKKYKKFKNGQEVFVRRTKGDKLEGGWKVAFAGWNGRVIVEKPGVGNKWVEGAVLRKAQVDGILAKMKHPSRQEAQAAANKARAEARQKAEADAKANAKAKAEAKARAEEKARAKEKKERASVKPEFRKGQAIKVQRSDGTVEAHWEVIGVHVKGNKVSYDVQSRVANADGQYPTKYGQTAARVKSWQSMKTNQGQGKKQERPSRREKYVSEAQAKASKEVLGIKGELTAASLKKAFHKKIREWHPDKFDKQPKAEQLQAHNKTQTINSARDNLKAYLKQQAAAKQQRAQEEGRDAA